MFTGSLVNERIILSSVNAGAAACDARVVCNAGVVFGACANGVFSVATLCRLSDDVVDSARGDCCCANIVFDCGVFDAGVEDAFCSTGVFRSKGESLLADLCRLSDGLPRLSESGTDGEGFAFTGAPSEATFSRDLDVASRGIKNPFPYLVSRVPDGSFICDHLICCFQKSTRSV